LARISHTISYFTSHGISESAVCRTIQKIEDALIQCGQFNLPGKKALQPSDTVIEVIVGALQSNPLSVRKKTRRHYSGKKKRHTQKAQVMINQLTMEIIATAFGYGSPHDFCLFKENYAGAAQVILCLADTGYRGINKIHAKSQILAKKSKLHSLTPEQKSANRELASQRVFCEHVIGRLKVFRI
jgi:hypothetical protein